MPALAKPSKGFYKRLQWHTERSNKLSLFQRLADINVRESQRRKFKDNECGFCGSEATNLTTECPICIRCLEEWDKVPVRIWKKLRYRTHAEKNHNRAQVFKNLFVFKKKGLTFSVDPFPNMKR